MTGSLGKGLADTRVERRLLQRAIREGSQALYRDPVFYDRLYGRRSEDVAFYTSASRAHGGPVLELGVGTGRVALALAEAGVQVVGIDAMASMLRAARALLRAQPQAVRERVALRRGDMRRLTLSRRFPLVIAPFNAFNHLYSAAELEQTLHACVRHLRPGGRLIFDVVMPDLPSLLQNPERIYSCGRIKDPRDGRTYRHYEASHYDALAQIRTVTMLFDPDDGKSPARAVPLTQRQYFPAELEGLLSRAGFELEARYGDFHRGPLVLQSESQVLIARAAKRPRPSHRRR